MISVQEEDEVALLVVSSSEDNIPLQNRKLVKL
jgi:hypothetical protein